MWTAVVVIVGSVVCVVLIISSVAVGFSFLVVPVLVAELMLLAAVYLARRALGAEEVAGEKQSAWYVGSLACLVLIISSFAVGLSFMVVPILVAELVLVAAVILARQALSPEEAGQEKQLAWYAAPGNSPSRVSERLYEPHPGHRPAGSPARGRADGRAPPTVRRSGQPRRGAPPARRRASSIR